MHPFRQRPKLITLLKLIPISRLSSKMLLSKLRNLPRFLKVVKIKIKIKIKLKASKVPVKSKKTRLASQFVPQFGKV